ncbi:MAG: fluoride efflux transporter CrcB [Methylobacillus sp.]|jgi:CrcB protein|nr:fluoride efflux transporter CrcB [Methylobacillus sp.]
MAGFAAVGIGAALGAWMRWGLGLLLNPLFPGLPYSSGTLAANLIGGYLIGICMALLPNLSPEIRLFAMTGFLGGLTTFSTFSAEAVALLQNERYGLLAAHISLHLLGSLALTGVGIWTVHLLRS